MDEYFDRDTQRCERCPAGHGSAGGLVTICYPCRDVINANNSDSSCWNDVSSQRKYYLPAVPADENGDCAPGTHRNIDGICIFYRAGTFSNSFNAAECQSCEENSVAADLGSSECIACPHGTMADKEDNICKVAQT